MTSLDPIRDIARDIAYNSDELAAIETFLNQLADGNYIAEVPEGLAMGETLERLKARLVRQTTRSLEMAVTLSMQTSEAAISNGRQINSSEDVSHSAQSISSASEELSASIGEINRNAEDAHELSSEVSNAASEGQDAAGRSREAMQDIVSHLNHSVTQADHLKEASVAIGSILKDIEAIAKQTNLLALNATIEAARAGDAGLGFAVVAREVKGLSNQSTQATENIQSQILTLRTYIENMVQSLSASEKSLHEGTRHVEMMETQMASIAEQSLNVRMHMADVSEVLSQQTAAAQEVAGSIMHVTSKTSESLDATHHLSNIVDKTASLIGQQLEALADANIPGKVVRLAKADHVLFKKRLADMFSGKQSLRDEELADHTACRLGKWYQGERAGRFNGHPSFQALEAPHKRFHAGGIEAARKFNLGDRTGALAEMDKVEEASQTVIALLDDLIDADTKS